MLIGKLVNRKQKHIRFLSKKHHNNQWKVVFKTKRTVTEMRSPEVWYSGIRSNSSSKVWNNLLHHLCSLPRRWCKRFGWTLLISGGKLHFWSNRKFFRWSRTWRKLCCPVSPWPTSPNGIIEVCVGRDRAWMEPLVTSTEGIQSRLLEFWREPCFLLLLSTLHWNQQLLSWYCALLHTKLLITG